LIKLGDFGCSVKLNNAQTMPGEVNSTMGTAGEWDALSLVIHSLQKGLIPPHPSTHTTP
jgi:hypothetical protein